MVRGRRYLVLRELDESMAEGFAATQARRFVVCPEAAQFTDEEAEGFLHAMQYMDSVDHKQIVTNLRSARISFPIELVFDEYRLGRHILRRWGDAALRQAFLQRALTLDFRVIRKLKGAQGVKVLLPAIERHTAPAIFSMLRHHGLSDVIPAVLAVLSPAHTARYRALLLLAKVLMHRYMTQPEPARQPSRWEQQKVARRIRLRDVQLHAMRRSVHSLRRERKALLRRVLAANAQQHPELDALAFELERLRAEAAEATRQHAHAMAQQAQAHREAVKRVQAELAAAQRDYRVTLAARTAWISSEGRQ